MVKRCFSRMVTCVLLAFTVVISARSAYAEMVGEDTARAAAEGFLLKSSVAKTILAGRSVDAVEAYGNMWIARLAPSGYIEVAGSTKCAPILSFSANDFAEPEVGSPFAAKLTSDTQIVEAKEADEDAADNAGWSKYTAPVATKRTLLGAAPSTADAASVVGPLLGATWNQSAPYSDFTPLSGPCGCAATAGGQEHRYWRWPYRFEGSREVNHSIQMANGAWYTHTIRANGLVPFDWDKIYGSYSGTPSIPNATDKDASYNAAYLTLWMQSLTAQVFKRGSSGATQKLRNYADQFWFERDATEANYWRDGYTNLWLAIKKDLDWGSPIQVNSPVHVMVVDGYAIENEGEEDEIDYINLNYGWGGAEGWVNLYTAVTEGTSGGRLADFQTGYRPQKKVQFEPLPKVCTSDVTLKWHMAPCYTNRTSGFTIEIAKAGGATTNDTITTHEETTTYTATGLDVGGAYTFTVTPIMKEGEGDGRSNSAVTTIGTPQPAPEITSVSSIAGGLEHSYQGIFVECARGSLNKINLTCSTSVTSLKAYSSHLTVLPDSKVTTVNNGNGSWTVNVDATAMDSTWDGDMVLLTLVAANSDGTEAYKNLVLRFNSMRQAPSGTLTLVETNPTDSVWFGGTTTLDADGQSVTFGANALNGNGTVTLQNGTFTFEGLNGFTGTLKWAPSVTVNLPADMSNFRGTLWFESYGGKYTLSRNLPSTAKVYIGGNTYLKPGNVIIDAALSGGGIISVEGVTVKFNNLKNFTGSVSLGSFESAGTMTIKAGEEKNVEIWNGTLYLTLDKAQVAYGYTTSQIKDLDSFFGAKLVFQDENGKALKTWTSSLSEYTLESSANTWFPDMSSGTGNFWDEDRWSQGLPSAGDYVIFNDNFGNTEMTLNLSSDFNLGYVKVVGTKFNIKAADGSANLSVDIFENEIPTKLSTTAIVPTVVVPRGKLFIKPGFTISCDIDYSLAQNLRDISDSMSALIYGSEYGETYCVWRGTVVFSDYDESSGLDILSWGHANSFVRLNGVKGYLTTLANEVIDIPIELKDNGSSPAFVWNNGLNKLTTINKIKGSGVMQTTGGGSERVLLKDISEFTGQFWLATKTVAIADEMPTENIGNDGRLHVCKAATIAAASTWNMGGGAYFGSGCDLDIYGQLWSLTKPMTTYGEDATITLEDGGVIRACTAMAGDYSPTLNFKAGKYQFEDAITETKTVNFCAGEGKYTTLDANGKAIILGANFFSGSGDIYLTSSSSGGSFTIQGIPAAFTGTIYVDSTVGLTLPSDLSSMGGKINISEITLARASSGIGNIEVCYGATLQVTLTDDEAMEGLTVTGVTLSGGAIEFVDQRGTVITSSTESTVYVKPADYTVPSPEPTAIWYNDFSSTNTGYALTDWQQTHGDNKSSVTIDQDNNGLFVDFASAKGYFTVLVKYSNLSASKSNKRVLFATTANSDYTRNRCGIRLLTDSKVQGLWNSSTTANSDADYGSASTGTVPSAGTLVFVYDKTSGNNVGGLTVYVAGSDETLTSAALWSNTALKAGDAYGFAVGGNCRDGSASGVEAAKGMTITGLAVFDRVLTASELKYFRWEDEEPGEEPEEPEVPEITYEVSPVQGEEALPAGTQMTVTCSDPTATIWYQKYGETEWTEYTEPVALDTGINFYNVKVNDGEATLYTFIVAAPETEPEPEYDGPAPVAVWVAGEFGDDKSAHGGLEFALNGNTTNALGQIVIGNSTTLGATIVVPDYDNATMLVKYSIPSGGAPVDKAAPVSMFVNYDLGAYANSGLTDLDGYWWNNSQVKTDFPFSSSAPSIPLEGYILISAPANSNNNTGDHYTAVYVGTSMANLSGGEADTVNHRLRFTGANNRVTSVGVGGPTVEGTKPWAGMVIESVALFDEWVTTNTIANYKFPEQGAVQPEDSDRYAIEPVVSWVNDFKTTTKGDYSLSVSGTTAAKDDSFGGTLAIGDAAAVIDATSAEAITVLVKYRTAPAIHSAPVVTFGGQAAVTFDSGICTDTSVDRQLSAYYSFIYGGRKRGIYAVGGNPTLSSDGGYVVCARKTDACLAYVGNSLDNMSGGECTEGMQISNSTLKKIGIGGQTELSNNDENMVPFSGFVVEKVVVFNGYYTPDQIRYVPNPEDSDTLSIASGATWNFAAGETKTYTTIGTLDSGGTIAITNASELAEGSYKIAEWTNPKLVANGQYSDVYGRVGTLTTEGLPAGLTAELVYGARAIYLRVYNPDTQSEKPTLKVWPYGDSITEGFNGAGSRANYRVLLAQKLTLLGYNVEMVGVTDKIQTANNNPSMLYNAIDPSGVVATNIWQWHSAKHGAPAKTGISGLGGRAALVENVDTLCAQVGKPDVVLLLIGVNDLSQTSDVDGVFDAWKETVNRILVDLPDTKVVVSTLLYSNAGNSGTVNPRSTTFNQKVQDEIASMPEAWSGRVSLADLNKLVDKDGAGILVNTSNDKLHPDWWGHDKMADGWLTQITNFYPSANGTFPSSTPLPTVDDSELGAAAKEELADYRNGFKLCRTIDVATGIAGDPYSSTGEGATENFEKVAYFVEYVRADNNAHKWVWVDMDAFGDADLASVGLPTTIRQQVVTKLHVKSNHNGIDDVSSDVDTVNGFIEFSPNEYDGSVSNVTGAATGWVSSYDWNDSLLKSGSGSVGCMQVHRISPPSGRGGQVLFAFNNWNQSTTEAEFGIGNFAQHFYGGGTQSMDYTYTKGLEKMNAAAYSVKRIEIWTKVTEEPGEPVFTVNASGVLTGVTLNGATEIVIPDTVNDVEVTTIGQAVFAGVAITSVTITANVTEIQAGAFFQCGSLASITFQGNAPTVGDMVFSGVDANCKVYVTHASTGWNVAIPGTWNGLSIDYSDAAPTVAMIGDEPYASLAEAVQAVTGDEPVEISLLLASDENVNLPSNVTVTETEANLYTGTLSGSGTLVLSATRSSSLSFGTWTGTVVLPSSLANIDGDFHFNYYGKEGSTVRLASNLSGWIQREDISQPAVINPAIEVPEGNKLTISGYSASFRYALRVLKGDGDFEITYDGNLPINDTNYSPYFRIGNISEFRGKISTAKPTLVLGTMTLPAKPANNTPEDSYARRILVYAPVTAYDNWSADNGIVLADAEATLTVGSGITVTTDPAISTSVANSRVKATGTNPVVYSVIEFIPALPEETPDAVAAAIKDASFEDTNVAAVINGSGDSVAEYKAFKTWAKTIAGGEEAVVSNQYAAAAYVLGATTLFENKPTVEICEAELNTTTGAMTLTVTVKDGENPKDVASEKVKDLFEATSDLTDWEGKKLTPGVTDNTQATSSSLNFVVVPDSTGKSPSAFLRIRK